MLPCMLVVNLQTGSVYPKLAVRLPCASASISSTFFPCFASPIPKLLVVVVLPTPPFWFAIAIILHMIPFSFAIYCSSFTLLFLTST